MDTSPPFYDSDYAYRRKKEKKKKKKKKKKEEDRREKLLCVFFPSKVGGWSGGVGRWGNGWIKRMRGRV